MSLGYYEGSDVEAIELIARYMDYLSKKDSWRSFADLFTESEIDELQNVLDKCCDSVYMRQELDADLPKGFFVSSSDEEVLNLMREIKEKQRALADALRESALVNDVITHENNKLDINNFIPIVRKWIPEKEAWQKYQDYCQKQIEKSNPDSKEYRYFMGEIAKCLEEINRD